MTFFFQVHLCEVENPQDLVSLDFPINVHKGQPLLVAVKILRPDATKNARWVPGIVSGRREGRPGRVGSNVERTTVQTNRGLVSGVGGLLVC